MTSRRANGGLQGKAVDVLWRVYAGEEVTNISEQTLQLAQAISMALQGSRGDELWSATLADMFLASHALRCNCSQKLPNRVVIITSLEHLRLDLLHKT